MKLGHREREMIMKSIKATNEYKSLPYFLTDEHVSNILIVTFLLDNGC